MNKTHAKNKKPKSTKSAKDAKSGVAAAAAFAAQYMLREERPFRDMGEAVHQHKKLEHCVREMGKPHEKATKAELILRIKRLEKAEASLAARVEEQRQKDAAAATAHRLQDTVVDMVRKFFPVFVPYEEARLVAMSVYPDAESPLFVLELVPEATEHAVFGEDAGHADTRYVADADICGVKLRAVMLAAMKAYDPRLRYGADLFAYVERARFQFMVSAESMSGETPPTPESLEKKGKEAAEHLDNMQATADEVAAAVNMLKTRASGATDTVIDAVAAAIDAVATGKTPPSTWTGPVPLAV